MSILNRLLLTLWTVPLSSLFKKAYLLTIKSGKVESTPERACARIQAGAQNTTKQAGNLPDSEVFSRPKFMVLDVGIVYPQGRRHNLFCVLNPHIHPECLKSARDGLSVQQGTETMTTVNTPITSAPDTIARQQAIEDALESALHFIRTGHPDHSLFLATARARRALSMLKQSCAEASQAIRAKMEGGRHDL